MNRLGFLVNFNWTNADKKLGKSLEGLVGPEGWEEVVKNYLPEIAFEKLKKIYYATN